MRTTPTRLNSRRPGALTRVTFTFAAAGLIVACGGDDDTEPAAAPAPTQAPRATQATEPTEAPAVTAADSAPAEGAPGAVTTVGGEGSDTTAVGEVTIEHYSGTDTVPVDPETVVVLDTGILLTLDALGISVDGFASLAVPTPEAFAAVVENPELVGVGTAFEPDYEGINALEPDLIIAATRSSAAYPELKKIAPTVDLTFDEDVDFLTAFAERHRQIGQIFGVEDEVEATLAEIDAEVARVKALTADAGTALIVMTNGTEVSAYGPGSRFGVVHDVLGYAAADESLERDATHGDVVSFEFIAEANPDVLFVIDRSAATGAEGETAETVLDNELVRQTSAWQNGRVVYVDGYSWYIATNSIPAVHAIIADVESSLG